MAKGDEATRAVRDAVRAAAREQGGDISKDDSQAKIDAQPIGGEFAAGTTAGTTRRGYLKNDNVHGKRRDFDESDNASEYDHYQNYDLYGDDGVYIVGF